MRQQTDLLQPVCHIVSQGYGDAATTHNKKHTFERYLKQRRFTIILIYEPKWRAS